MSADLGKVWNAMMKNSDDWGMPFEDYQGFRLWGFDCYLEASGASMAVDWQWINITLSG